MSEREQALRDFIAQHGVMMDLRDEDLAVLWDAVEPHGFVRPLISEIRRRRDIEVALTKERDLLQLRVDALRAVFDCTTLPGAAARLVQLLDERGHGAFDRDVEDAIGELTKMVGPLR